MYSLFSLIFLSTYVSPVLTSKNDGLSILIVAPFLKSLNDCGNAPDFLTDLLAIIEVSATKDDAKAAEIDGVKIEGILAGFDQQNQTYSFVEGEVLTIFRSVENTFDLELDKGGAYNISILTADKALDITINGGGENAIYIYQSQ